MSLLLIGFHPRQLIHILLQHFDFQWKLFYSLKTAPFYNFNSENAMQCSKHMREMLVATLPFTISTLIISTHVDNFKFF